MHTTLKDTAGFVHHWLGEKGPAQDAVVVCQTQDEGLDLARLLIKKRLGDFAAVRVHCDALPTYAANEMNGRRCFIVSQPDHLDTVRVTRHEPAQGELFERTVSAEEAAVMRQLSGDRVDPKVVEYLKGSAGQDFAARPYDLIIVDAEEPGWSWIVPERGPNTVVHMTERVRVGPPLK